jgi:ubiquinone/menaquinone biosynthesis C-methylase UbiE
VKFFQLLTCLLLSTFLLSQSSIEAKSKKQAASIFDSDGVINQVQVENNQVTFTGEISCYHPYRINNFLVQFANKSYTVYHSPLDRNFSFSISFSPEELQALTNALITVTPQMSYLPTHPMYYIYQPLYSVPTDEEAQAVGSNNFLHTGQIILGLLTGRGQLKPTDTVLDVGCGMGRVAYPLAYYLDPQARYEGFDIDLNFIVKAQEMISSYFPNFNFQHVNIFNSVYNPQGNLLSSEFRFPYDDQTFDFIFLTSVFTHMLPEDVSHYLQEIKRVLKPNGTCLATCFLLDKKTRQLLKQTDTKAMFAYPYEGCFISNPLFPEAAVAYNYKNFMRLISSHGLETQKVYRGCWSGRNRNYTSYQDMVIIKNKLIDK